MRITAIIPARGGSKGVVGKNLRTVGGISLLGRSVLAGKAAARVEGVFVSTDDAAIAKEARRHGAEVILRPDALADDIASSEAALLHGLDELAAQGREPDILVFLQCTSAFTTAGEIDICIAGLERTGAECALSVAPNHGFLWRMESDGIAQGINHDETQPRKRRQELEPQYLETGAIYVMRVAPFRAVGRRFCGRVVAVPIAHIAPEIDSEDDLRVANAVAEGLAQGGAGNARGQRSRANVLTVPGCYSGKLRQTPLTLARSQADKSQSGA
jgi:N-acylneuraminate cytidylyltransferase